MSEPRYSVVIRDFVNSSGSDYSAGDVILFVDNPHHLAWTEYMNEVGEAFWSMSQRDANLPRIKALATLLYRPHVQIYRNEELVWGGWLGEIDESDGDVIFYAYSYLSGFYDILTSFTQEWTGKTVAFIVEAAFDAAVARTRSRVHWFTQGTIENPWTTSGGPTGITMPFYRAPFKRVLSLFKEMAAYATSDTTNHVIFEVTPAGQFNFWRNRKNTVNNVLSTYGGGNIRSFRRIRRPVERRSVLQVVGTSPTDVNLNTTKTHTALHTEVGLSEEPIYLSFVRDSDELARVASTRLARAARNDTDLYISFHKDSIVPYRAAAAVYRIGDVLSTYIDHGLTFTQEDKVIVGQQVVYAKQSENVRLLLADKLDGTS